MRNDTITAVKQSSRILRDLSKHYECPDIPNLAGWVYQLASEAESDAKHRAELIKYLLKRIDTLEETVAKLSKKLDSQ
jgi:hypothetical protein